MLPGQVCSCARLKAVVSSLMPDTEMSEEINCRAGNVAGSGDLEFAACYAGSHSFARKNPPDRRKCVRLWNTSQSGEVAGRLLAPGLFFNVHKIRVDSDNKR